MASEYPIDKMVRRVRTIKRAAIELKDLSGGIQAIDRNADRILASVKILEANIVDAASIIAEKDHN